MTCGAAPRAAAGAPRGTNFATCGLTCPCRENTVKVSLPGTGMPEFYEEEHTEVLARVVWARRRPSMLWLCGAVLSFAVALAITLFAPPSRGELRGEALQTLQREATEIGRAVDAAALAAHRRADTIAASAMIRAAILTDAA